MIDLKVQKFSAECLQNPCSVKPCTKGTCISKQNGADYTCVCEEGWTGEKCDSINDYCATVYCMNNGTCKNVAGSFQCHCQPGYNGVYCEAYANNYCLLPNGQPADCGNGICVNNLTDYDCNCNAGFYGVNCQNRTDFCASTNCGETGQCRNGYYNAMCECNDGCVGLQCIETDCLKSTDKSDLFSCMANLVGCDPMDNPFKYALGMLGDVLTYNHDDVDGYDQNFRDFLLRYRDCTYEAINLMFQQPVIFPCCANISIQMPLIMAGCMRQENFAGQSRQNFPDFDSSYFGNSCCESTEIHKFKSSVLLSCIRNNKDDNSFFACMNTYLESSDAACGSSGCVPPNL